MFPAICTIRERSTAPTAAVSFDISVNTYEMFFVSFRAFELSLTEFTCVFHNFTVLQLMLPQSATSVQL